MLMPVFFLDLSAGLHPGDRAGSAGCSRRGGAGVRPGALLCSCSRLQLRLEVEDQRRGAGDQIEAAAVSCYQPQCHLNHCTCGLMVNCLCVRAMSSSDFQNCLFSKCVLCLKCNKWTVMLLLVFKVLITLSKHWAFWPLWCLHVVPFPQTH